MIQLSLAQPFVRVCRLTISLQLATIGVIGIQPRAFAVAEFVPIASMSIAYAVSGDSSTVVGEGLSQAVTWTRDQGVLPIASTPASWQGYGFDITRDGQTILANYPCDSCQYGYPVHMGPSPPSGQAIWTQATGLTFTQRFDTYVRAFGPNNNTLLGRHFSQPAYNIGQGWTQLGMLPGIYNGTGVATASSADNSTIVGYCNDGSSNSFPFRWSAQNGIEPLSLPAGFTHGTAWTISDDGSVIAGVLNGSYDQIFRWTESGGMQLLGQTYTRPVMSADGSTLAWSASARSVVTGYGYTQQAYVWDADHGLRLLQTVLQEAGANLTGYELNFVNDISPDGRTFVGRATEGHEGSSTTQALGFVATLGVPEPATVIIAFTALLTWSITRSRRSAAA